MDIQFYKQLKQGLINYFSSLTLTSSYTPNIVGYEPSKPTYPLIKLVEVRNVANERFGNYREKVANISYKVDIYAKTSGSIAKDDIARTLAKYCDDYLTYTGLKQVSFNVFENDGQNGDLYHITIMYTMNLLEQRQFIL